MQIRQVYNFSCGLLMAAALISCNSAISPPSGTDNVFEAIPNVTPVIVRDPSVEAKISNIIGAMSLEEKVAQMRVFHANKGIELGENDELILSDDVKERLKLGTAGIKNPGEFLTPEKAALLNNKLQKYIIENSRHGIPGLFITEAYNGVDATGTTRFGRPINMASTFDPELVQDVWDTIGREARLRGLHMCHSPEADIMRDPRFGRMSEAYSEDTHLTTEMVVAAVRGVQGETKGLSDGTHIGATTKHFAGYGQIEGGRNFASVQVSPRILRDQIFPPFKAAVQRGESMAVMAAHGDINGVAVHGSREMLTEILREDWGFDGYLISDSNDIARLNTFMKVAETEEDAAVMGLKAGNDIDLYSEIAYSYLPDLAREDPDLVPFIDEAVRRVLRVKFKLGLFENPYIDVPSVAPNVRNAASLALAYKADLESVTLLKNENETLPLKPSGQKIALIGPLLGEDTANDFKSVMTGATIIAEKGFNLTDREKRPRLLTSEENEIGFAKAMATAREADTVILFLGGNEFTTSEAYFNAGYGDRASLDLVGQQNDLLREIAALGKPLIVVLKHRRTLTINEVAQTADAALLTWDLSEQGDTALAHLIQGDANPSGKLPVTVPRHIGQIPFHYSQMHINYKKDYLFEEEGPLFPFGFGLSYTNFDLSDLALSSNELTREGRITASVTLTNTGQMQGKEVVQLYIRDHIGSVLRPIKELKAFKKIELAPGASQRVSFDITNDMLEFTRKDMSFGSEPGDFTLEVGNSSAGGLTADFKLVAE